MQLGFITVSRRLTGFCEYVKYIIYSFFLLMKVVEYETHSLTPGLNVILFLVHLEGFFWRGSQITLEASDCKVMSSWHHSTRYYFTVVPAPLLSDPISSAGPDFCRVIAGILACRAGGEDLLHISEGGSGKLTSSSPWNMHLYEFCVL